MTGIYIATDGEGNIFYLDAEKRTELIKEYLEEHGDFDVDPDTEKYLGRELQRLGKADRFTNRMIYYPFDRDFDVTRLRTTDDTYVAYKKMKALDMGTVVDSMIIKPVVCPHDIKRAEPGSVTEQEKEWVEQCFIAEERVYEAMHCNMWKLVYLYISPTAGRFVRHLYDKIRWVTRAFDYDAGYASQMYLMSFFDARLWKDVVDLVGFDPVKVHTNLWEAGLFLDTNFFDLREARLTRSTVDKIGWSREEKIVHSIPFERVRQSRGLVLNIF